MGLHTSNICITDIDKIMTLQLKIIVSERFASWTICKSILLHLLCLLRNNWWRTPRQYRDTLRTWSDRVERRGLSEQDYNCRVFETWWGVARSRRRYRDCRDDGGSCWEGVIKCRTDRCSSLQLALLWRDELWCALWHCILCANHPPLRHLFTIHPLHLYTTYLVLIVGYHWCSAAITSQAIIHHVHQRVGSRWLDKRQWRTPWS